MLSEELRAKNRAYFQAWYVKHRERVLAKLKANYHRDRDTYRLRNKHQYQKHRAKRLAEVKAYRLMHADQAKAAIARWNAAHPEYQAAYNREYRIENAEKLYALSKTWREKHPENVKAYGLNRRARKKNSPNRLTAAELKAIVAYSNGRCRYCGIMTLKNVPSVHPRKRHFDHIVALANGGAHSADNIVVACATCNRKKWKHEGWTPKSAEEIAALLEHRPATAPPSR